MSFHRAKGSPRLPRPGTPCGLDSRAGRPQRAPDPSTPPLIMIIIIIMIIMIMIIVIIIIILGGRPQRAPDPSTPPSLRSPAEENNMDLITITIGPIVPMM